jgi:hydrogenase-1 operon protein HyaF
MKPFPIPVVALGAAGALAADDESLDFIRMPQGMSTFQMPPAPAVSDPAALAEARAFLRRLHESARTHRFATDSLLQLDVSGLSPRALGLVNEALGEGEVAAIIDEPAVRLQETAFPGFWRVRTFDDAGQLIADAIEVAPVPALVAESALLGSRCRMPKHPVTPGVVNAPSLLTELVDASTRGPEAQAHVVNLTLLPVTAEDIQWLVGALEVGPVTLLSRGYGNCRITSTRLRHTWWVQYFNSMDHLILNTIEVAVVPEVALAAPDDFADSVERLGEWLTTL